VRTKECILVLWLLVFPISVAIAQQAEYNMGSNWVYPTAQKFVGMNFTNTSSGSVVNNGTILYGQSLTNDGTVDFVTSLPLSPALSQFVGVAVQRIAGSGSTRFYSLQFANHLVAGAISLEQTINVAQKIDFTKGIVTALQTTPETAMNLVQLEANATTINASDNSFVDGFVSKLGNSEFSFPIGNGGFYRPASISAPAAATDCFAARYIYSNPDVPGYSITKFAPPLTHVSDKEYWVINRISGTSNGQVTLSWDVNKTSAIVPSNLKSMSVARWDGTKWINEGNIAYTGDATSGTVTANVTGYGIFTLASTLLNPPVAVADDVTSFEDKPSTGNLLANDQVSNGTTLTLTSYTVAGTTYLAGANTTIPKVGTITITANGTYTFIPVLNFSGDVPTITYTITDDAAMAATGNLNIKVFALPEFQMSSNQPVMNSDGTYSWVYLLTVRNDTQFGVESAQVIDNLDDVFKSSGCTYKITSVTATGSLKANGLYNGSNISNLLIEGSVIAPNSLDSIRMEVKVETNSKIDSIYVFNQAKLTGSMNLLNVSLLSDDNNVIGSQDPTQTVIPADHIYIPNAFSPNGDGINDNLVINHDEGSKVELEIFNREGGLVYKSTDYQDDWIGKGMNGAAGKELVDGTYYISVRLIDRLTGEVTAKRVRFITLRRVH
jgi:gliding motility-associated-like protein